MKASLITKLENLGQRAEELAYLLTGEKITENLSEYRKLTRELAEITPVVTTFRDWQHTQEAINQANELMQDPDLQELAATEIAAEQIKLQELEQKLQLLLIPADADDHKNIILEIRAGTGGDEAGLFAGALFRMYAKYAADKGWKINIITANESEIGGYKEIIAQIQGQDIYQRLKFESGGHRVQRIPETESQGRVHTSACTVAVMPEADELAAIDLNPNDLRIDTFRASGAGGQHINKTDSAVRITHIPSGMVVECQDNRSQHSNKAQALKVLASRLHNQQKQEAQNKEAQFRKSLIGSGDRSARIRTYNYPQGRVTDHRINLSLYKLETIMDGQLDELINPLLTEYRTEQLEKLNAEEN